jgi:hypothetical protein
MDVGCGTWNPGIQWPRKVGCYLKGGMSYARLGIWVFEHLGVP